MDFFCQSDSQFEVGIVKLEDATVKMLHAVGMQFCMCFVDMRGEDHTRRRS